MRTPWHKESDGFLQRMRNFIFGVEDSLVSTVGLLSGVATAGADRRTVIMTGVVLIFVEAFSMGVGSYLSERATQESGAPRIGALRNTIISSAIMLVSYFGAGFVPLFPYIFFSSDQAFTFSLVASLVALVILGIISAEALKTNVFHNSLRMFLMGGVAIALGVFVGMWFT